MGPRATLWKTHLVLMGTGFLVLGAGFLTSRFLNQKTPHGLFSEPTSTPPAKPLICENFYRAVCDFESRKDPTGRVPQPFEGEVKVLRRFERLVRDYPDMTRDQIDEILVREVYTPERLKQLRDLERVIKGSLKKFISLQLLGPPAHKKQMSLVVDRVRLELPPPASVYADERSLLTSEHSFYYRSPIGGQKVRMGGALVDSVSSRYNLVFTLAHEVAHSVSPCELKAFHLPLTPVGKFLSCVDHPSAEPLRCDHGSTLSEVFSDWVATNILVSLIQTDLKRKKIHQRDLVSAVVNSVRDLCPTHADQAEQTIARDLSSEHPSPEHRLNGIVAQHPALREMLGCVSKNEEPENPAPLVPPRCF